VFTGCALLGGVLAFWWRTPRDLQELSNDQLVDLALAKGWPPARDDVAGNAVGILLSRPAPERWATAVRLAGDASPLRRALGAGLFTGERRDFRGGKRDELAAHLEPMLDDADARVRRQALGSFANLCFHDIDRAVPERAFAVARELFAASDPKDRGTAVAAAAELGRRVAPLRDALVELVRREPDGGLRFLATSALLCVRPVDAGLQEVRRRMLDDSDPNVRWTAASWFEVVPEGGADAIPRLLAMAQDGNEDRNARRGAVSALARLPTDREQAALVFALLLAMAPNLEEIAKDTWCRDVGRIAAAVAGSPSLVTAGALLRDIARDESHRVSAVAALARVAAAQSEVAFRPDDVEALRAAVRKWHESVRESSEYMPFEAGADDAVEALLLLSGSPERGVRTDEIRPVLETVAKSDAQWLRDWARELLQRLAR